MNLISHNVTDTHAFARKILNNLQNHNVLALYGDLGAGKTTFVQGLARALGISKRLIIPTYVLMRQYPTTKTGSAYNNLIHLDLYRVNGPDDLKSIDLIELMATPTNLVVIEWAEKADSILPPRRLDIHFESAGNSSHKITLNPKP